MSVATITAADPDGLQANQGFNVTVESAATNQAPVAVGTIPGSRLQIGGTSTIDVAGYFSDPDGDELSYTGASSNPTVATVSMEGSTATINAVATGDAVITITASDGSASVSQGFRIDVPAGPEEATVVISRLLDANRQQISDPTGIAGTIYAVLDVQSNDETWTEIGLTLNGETVSPLCRGTGGTSADVAVGPGLAAAGQVEIECVLKTNDVLGQCEGMPLDPKYANGEYELSAFLTTDEGATREVVASQPIELGNPNFVAIAHVPGSESSLGNHTKGLTFYGGPAVEGNVNMFHACPVAYDGTEVGAMQLTTVVTDTEQNPVAAPGPKFRTVRNGAPFPVDDEAPFTWSIITEWWSGNHAYYTSGGVSAENVPGETETWVVNSGLITDPNGLDVSSKFRAAGEAKYGPLHFDYRSPSTSSANSQIAINASRDPDEWGPVPEDRYYSDGSSSSPTRLWITAMSDGGVGHVYGQTSAMAVGDCSVRGNADASGSTAFTPLEGRDNVTHITQLDEEDPSRNGVADIGGIDCYVAEVQALADRLGNSVVLSEEPRIRTAEPFGVDRTNPVVSRKRPSEPLVLDGNSLLFEVEDPLFETREEGSGPNPTIVVRAGATRGSGVYWTTTAPVVNGSVEINIDPPTGSDIWGNNYFAREIEHTVYALVRDNAGNGFWEPFTFTRDHSDPALALSAVPSSFGATNAASVSVTVAGTLTDATEIRRAFLSIHHGTDCTAANPLDARQVSGPVRRLHNGTNKIEFSEVFTIKRAGDQGLTNYCFFLDAEDDARTADNGPNMNFYRDAIASFSVTWPTAPAPPVATAAIPAAMLQMGGTETSEVDLVGHFRDPNGDDLTYAVANNSDATVASVTLDGSTATVTALAAGSTTITFSASDGTGSATQNWAVTVAAAPLPMFEFVATDGTAIADPLEVNEGAATGSGVMYSVKAPDATTAATVTLTGSPGVLTYVNGSFASTLTFPNADGTSDTLNVEVLTVHDLDIMSDMGTVTHSATGFGDGMVAVQSIDDDLAITTDVTSIAEDDDAEEVTVTVTAGTATDAARTVTVTIRPDAATDAVAADFQGGSPTPATVDVTIAANATSGEATVNVDAAADVAQDETGEKIELAQAGSTEQGVYYVPASISIVDNDPDINVELRVDGAVTDQVSEAAGKVTVTITATARAPVNARTTFTLAEGGDVNSPTDYLDNLGTITLTIPARGTTGSTSFDLTVVDDSNVEGTETLELADADGASDGARILSPQIAKLKFIDNDSN